MNWKDKMKQKWNEDPWTCIMILGIAATAVAKGVDAYGAYKGRSAYAKQVDFRINGRR